MPQVAPEATWQVPGLVQSVSAQHCPPAWQAPPQQTPPAQEVSSGAEGYWQLPDTQAAPSALAQAGGALQSDELVQPPLELPLVVPLPPEHRCDLDERGLQLRTQRDRKLCLPGRG